VRSKHFDIFKYLIEDRKADLKLLNSDKNNILFAIVDENDLQLMMYVLDDRKVPLDVNWQNEFGDTLLHKIAYQHKDIEMLKYLVEKKQADVNLPNREGRTPLHCAASRNAYHISNYLIDHGANTEIKDEYGHHFWRISYFKAQENETGGPVRLPRSIGKPEYSLHELAEHRLHGNNSTIMSAVGNMNAMFPAHLMTLFMIGGPIFGKRRSRQTSPPKFTSYGEIDTEMAVDAVGNAGV